MWGLCFGRAEINKPFLLSFQEVIQLTKNLMNEEGNDDGKSDPANVAQGDEIRHNFLPGDIVLAPWSEDGQ